MRVIPKIGNHYWVVTSIMISILTFGGSINFLFKNINRSNREVQFMLADTTSYNLGQHGDLDTLYLGGGIAKKNYFDSIKSSGIQIHPADVVQVEGRYYRSSKIIRGSIFSDGNPSVLAMQIAHWDHHFTAFAGEEYRQGSFFFNRNPKIMIWMLLISILVATSLSLIPYYLLVTGDALNLQSRSIVFLNFIASVFVILLLFLPFILVNDNNFVNFILPSNVEPIWGVGFNKHAIITVAVIPYVGALFWLTAILTINSKLSSVKLTGIEIQKYLVIIERLIYIMSGLLVFGVFCTDILTRFINDVIVQGEGVRIFPPEFIITNGITQSFLLLIIYLLVLVNIGDIKPHEASDGNKAPSEDRGINTLKIAIAILAPFLSSTIEPIVTSIVQ